MAICILFVISGLLSAASATSNVETCDAGSSSDACFAAADEIATLQVAVQTPENKTAVGAAVEKANFSNDANNATVVVISGDVNVTDAKRPVASKKGAAVANLSLLSNDEVDVADEEVAESASMGKDGTDNVDEESQQLQPNGVQDEVEDSEKGPDFRQEAAQQTTAANANLGLTDSLITMWDENIAQPLANATAVTCIQGTAKPTPVILSVVGGLLGGCCVLLSLCKGLGSVGYSLISMICFGCSLFLLGYANQLFQQPYQYLYAKFSTQGVVGVVCHQLFKQFDLKNQYSEDVEVAKKKGLSSLMVFAVLPAVSLVAAEYSANIGFSVDPCNAGVNSAIITMDPIVVFIFFYFYANETPSLIQFIGACFAISGAALDGLSSGGTGSMLAIAWCLVSMFSFATNVITSRFSGQAGVGSSVPWASQQIAVGVCGVILTAGRFGLGDAVASPVMGKYVFTPDMFVWALLGCLAQSTGIYSVILSFQCPNVVAGVNGAIFGSCSVVNFVLDWVLLNAQPAPVKLLSMGIILTGVTTLSLSS